MRKDIQFGLTIGGLLLAVLVIYLAVFTHSSKKPQDVAVAPATQPSEEHGGALDVTQGGAASGNDLATPARVAVIATTQPAGVAAAAASGESTGRDWSTLLASGASTTQPAEAAATGDAATASTETAGGNAVQAAATTTLASGAGASGAATHKVAAGESFYTIAKAVYGDGKYYSRLADANPNVPANKLRVGMVINVPALAAAAARPLASAQPVAVADSAPATAALDPVKSYRVKASDTLMAIARKLYGNGGEWEKIYDANRDSIGPNPARLKIDMVLRLPEAPTLALTN